jgi:phage terminase large subunit
MAMKKRVNIAQVIGAGYKDFWFSQHRYLIVKGGRGSKKSTTAALKIIYTMMKQPLTNALVIRRVFNTLRDSCFQQLKWAVERLKVSHLWKFTLSPLEAVYLPTGQRILFRGLDDPMSITSITVDKGYINLVWFEEFYQVEKEDDFNKIDMSIRGEMEPGYYKQIIMTFNPWSEKHWIKRRFFDNPDSNTLALTTTYKCNEWLGADDIALFEAMKINNPRRYRIEGEGEWGVSQGLIYTNVSEREFDVLEVSKRPGTTSIFGLDFGYTNDPTAFICGIVDEKAKELYIYDEHYEKAMTNSDIAKMIKYKGYAKEQIIADSAEPKSIEEIKRAGIPRIKAAAKGKDSILNGIQLIQDYKLIVHPKCENTLLELSNYIWDTKDGTMINKPIDDYNHLLDALRYGMERIKRRDIFITDKSFYNL